jgi:penicillin-binding protein 1B
VPDGVEIVSIDSVSNLLSDASCPASFNAAFLAGTAPTETCEHAGEKRSVLQKIFGLGKSGN